jgi:hypothetical protein
LTLHWLLGYELREGRAEAFVAYLRSKQFKGLRDKLYRETGIRIVATYLTVEPSSAEAGDYDAWDLWEIPNYAAIDKYVASQARVQFVRSYLAPFIGSSYKWITLQQQEFSK